MDRRVFSNVLVFILHLHPADRKTFCLRSLNMKSSVLSLFVWSRIFVSHMGTPAHSRPGTDRLGLRSVPKMGTGRGKGEFGIGNWLPPPSTALPLAPFSSGRHQGKGGRRKPYDDLPCPLPHLLALGAARQSWVKRLHRGGGRQKPPITHPHPVYAWNRYNVANWRSGRETVGPKSVIFGHKKRLSKGLDVKCGILSTCLDASRKWFSIGIYSINRVSEL